MESELIRLVSAIAALGAAIPSLEFVLCWPETRRWFPLLDRADATAAANGWCRLSRGNESENLLLVRVMAVRFLISMLLIVFAAIELPLFFPLAAAAAISFLSIRMRKLALDGADQMTTITFGALALASLVGSVAAQRLALYYLAGQSMLSYLSAGVAKLVSREWMLRGVLASILNNYTYGHGWFANILLRHKSLNRAMSAAVGIAEVVLPILAMLPGDLSIIAALTLGLMFHLGCAVCMGLNNFVCAFAATYPAIYYLHWRIYG